MKRQTILLLASIIFITAFPLWWVDASSAGEEGKPSQIFGGADNQAQEAIGKIAPQYQPWFSPILEPASPEIASLLFALQAAIGAGMIGYWLGSARTREKMRRDHESSPTRARGAPDAG